MTQMIAHYSVTEYAQFKTAFALAKAIARHENGGHYWSDATIAKGLELAGVRA